MNKVWKQEDDDDEDEANDSDENVYTTDDLESGGR